MSENPQFAIAEGMVDELRKANPEIDPARFEVKLKVRVRTVEELFKLVPPTVGKQAFVIPRESEHVARASRGEDRNSYSCGVVALDRLDPPNEHLLDPDHAEKLVAWGKERIAWVRKKIRIPLFAPAFAPTPGAYCEYWTMTELIDLDLLEQHGIFLSDLEFAYEIDEPNH